MPAIQSSVRIPPAWRHSDFRRRQLIELHEQPWFPSYWRSLFQRGLGRAQIAFGAFDRAAPLIDKLLAKVGSNEILDLCSGSAEVSLHLRRQTPTRPRLVLSDLYPDIPSFERHRDSEPGVDFYSESVNALNPPPNTPRVRTIISALHHFRPHQVRQILADAAANADGFIVLESNSRTWRHILNTLLIPIPAMLITAFGLRPWKPAQLLWGLLLPVVPLVALIDGIVSSLRSYSRSELLEMVEEIDAPDFEWTTGTVQMANSKLESSYLMGWRISRAEEVEKRFGSAPDQPVGQSTIEPTSPEI